MKGPKSSHIQRAEPVGDDESGIEIPAPQSQQAAEKPQTQKSLALPKSNGRAAQKQAVYTGYLEVFEGNSEQAMNTILQITEGRGSKAWTDDDLTRLKVDLEQRRNPTSQSVEDTAAFEKAQGF